MPQAAFKALVSRHLTKGVVLLFVALLFACGSSATATPAPSTGGDTPAATTAPASGSSASSPTAVPKATEAPEKFYDNNINISLYIDIIVIAGIITLRRFELQLAGA